MHQIITKILVCEKLVPLFEELLVIVAPLRLKALRTLKRNLEFHSGSIKDVHSSGLILLILH